MIRFVAIFIGILVAWALLIGWSVTFAFSDRSYAANVSGILLSPMLLLPLPGSIIFYALAFWVILSLLALFRDITVCRYLAMGLLVCHWLGALYLIGQDIFAEHGWQRFSGAFVSHPQLMLFIIVYGFSQFVVCKVLGGYFSEAT